MDVPSHNLTVVAKKLMPSKSEEPATKLKLSDTQAFTRVFEDPSNRALAEAERRGNRPGGAARSVNG
jgi:hypothetical protein